MQTEKNKRGLLKKELNSSKAAAPLGGRTIMMLNIGLFLWLTKRSLAT
jgi:hypothetical protein